MVNQQQRAPLKIMHIFQWLIVQQSIKQLFERLLSTSSIAKVINVYKSQRRCNTEATTSDIFLKLMRFLCQITYVSDYLTNLMIQRQGLSLQILKRRYNIQISSISNVMFSNNEQSSNLKFINVKCFPDLKSYSVIFLFACDKNRMIAINPKFQCVHKILSDYNSNFSDSKMGCESSRLDQLGEITISIVDPAFSKSQSQKLKDKLAQNRIKHEFYISVNCFIDQFMRRYINEVVAGLQNYREVYEKLKRLNFTPNIYVIGKYKDPSTIEENNKNSKQGSPQSQEPGLTMLPDNVIFVEHYDELIRILQDKSRKVRRIDELEQKVHKPKQKKIDVKILKKPNTKQTSEELIFQSTLKNKDLSHQIYDNFHQLQQSMLERDSHFIVTDYVYHKEVIALVGKSKAKVICSCTLAKEESYDPQVYFISNNFLQIASEIANQISLKNMHNVHCGKIYFYTAGIKDPKDFVQEIEAFNFQVRTFSDLDKMLKETTFFFCVTVLAAEGQIKNVQKYLHRNQYSFKVKVVALGKNVEPTAVSMRKILKEFKKGYKAEKGVTNSIDIIDKHFDNVKFEEIKSELQSNSINCYGYFNLNNYTKNKKFISPFIICNYQERILLCRYLKQVDSSAKVVIFCNKTKINNELKNDKNFAYVSSHFGKIISFIKKKEVFRPVIYGQNQIKLNEKVEKLKNKNKRISALKWCGLQQNASGVVQDNSDKHMKQDEFQFINIAKNASFNSIRDLQKDAAILWKLDYKPFSSFNSFKHDLTDSLAKLKRMYKINYPQQQFATLLGEIKEMDIGMLLTKVKQFFDSENQLGLNINSTLIKIDSLNKNDITCLREFLFLANLNFISIYRMPRVGKVRLRHWISHPMVSKCEVGSFLLTKNFLVFYEENSLNSDSLSNHKIVTEIKYDTLLQNDLNVNSFFKYKDKYIFSPYSQFVIKRINTDLTGITQIELQYVKNVEYLKYFYSQNLLKDGQAFIQLFKKAIESTNQQNEKKISPMIDFRILSGIRLNYQRVLALKAFRQSNYPLAIEFHRKTIKQEQEQENLDSVKINQLNYQLAYFLLKNGQVQQAGNVIKQIREAKPCNYLLQRCKQIVNDVVTQLQAIQYKPQAQSNRELKQKEKSYKDQTALKLKKCSNKGMRTFVWLKQNEGDLDDLEDTSNRESMHSMKMHSQKEDQSAGGETLKKLHPDLQDRSILKELRNTEKQIGCLEIKDEMDSEKQEKSHSDIQNSNEATYPSNKQNFEIDASCYKQKQK